MGFQLTYAGVPFALPESLGGEKVVDFIDSYYPLDDLRDVMGSDETNWPGKNLQATTWAQNPRLPKLRLYQWYYPAGASNWSIFRGLATTQQYKQMLKATAATGTVTPQDFKIQSDARGKDDSITTKLYMLSARPVSVPGSGETPETLYLITLVDERYWWQFEGAVQVDLTGTQTTWDGLTQYLADQLVITGTFEAVDSVYFKPAMDAALFSSQENPAALLDAVAYNTGREIMRKYDGTYLIHKSKGSGPGVSVIGATSATVAGGEVLKSDTNFEDQRRSLLLPQAVSVTFPKVAATTYIDVSGRTWIIDSYGAVHTVTINIGSVAPRSDGMDYTRFGKVPITKVFHDTAWATYGGGSSGAGAPSNQTDLTTLATRIAQDYWDQCLNSVDVVYPGIHGSFNTAGDFDLLFSYRGGNVTTRVFRQPYNYGPVELQHCAGPGNCSGATRPCNCVDTGGGGTGGGGTGGGVIDPACRWGVQSGFWSYDFFDPIMSGLSGCCPGFVTVIPIWRPTPFYVQPGTYFDNSTCGGGVVYDFCDPARLVVPPIVCIPAGSQLALTQCFRNCYLANGNTYSNVQCFMDCLRAVGGTCGPNCGGVVGVAGGGGFVQVGGNPVVCIPCDPTQPGQCFNCGGGKFCKNWQACFGRAGFAGDQTTNGPPFNGPSPLNVASPLNVYTPEAVRNYVNNRVIAGGFMGNYTGTVTGDGATSSFNIDHNLGTKNLLVQVWDSSNVLLETPASPASVAGVSSITATTVNRVVVVFLSPPGVGVTYTVVIHA